MKNLLRWWSTPKTNSPGREGRAGNGPRAAVFAVWAAFALLWICVPLSADSGGGTDSQRKEAQERYDHAQPGQCYATPAGNVACKFASSSVEESTSPNIQEADASPYCNGATLGGGRKNQDEPIFAFGECISRGLVVGVIVAAITTAILIATWLQALYARKALYVGQRAYILMKPPGVEPAYIPDPIVPGGQRQWVTINLSVRNAGNTPAQIINCRCGFQFHDGENLPARPDYNTKGFDDLRRWVPISGNATLKHYVGKTNVAFFDQGNREAPNNLFLYFLGYVEYLDIFEKPHRTRFCFLISATDKLALFRGGRKYNGYT